MRILYTILVSIIFIACGITKETMVDIGPSLIEQTQLPPLPNNFRGIEYKLETRLLISEEGSVLKAFLYNSDFNDKWNYQVLDELRNWKYLPALKDGKPVSIWVKQSILIRVSNPMIYELGEIINPDKIIIDSVYNMLLNGKDFESIAAIYSTANTKMIGGYLGKKDIMNYPYFVQKEIQDLSENQFTKPFRTKGNFCILKKIK